MVYFFIFLGIYLVSTIMVVYNAYQIFKLYNQDLSKTYKRLLAILCIASVILISGEIFPNLGSLITLSIYCASVGIIIYYGNCAIRTLAISGFALVCSILFFPEEEVILSSVLFTLGNIILGITSIMRK